MEQPNIHLLIRNLNSVELDNLYFFLQDMKPESSKAQEQVNAILNLIEEESN